VWLPDTVMVPPATLTRAVVSMGLPSRQSMVALYSPGPVSTPPGTVKVARGTKPVGMPWNARAGVGEGGLACGATSTTVAVLRPVAVLLWPVAETLTSLMDTVTALRLSSA